MKELNPNYIDWTQAKVKRLHSACCGMKNGQTYEARISIGKIYCSVQLENGDWIDSHYMPGFFEVIE